MVGSIEQEPRANSGSVPIYEWDRVSNDVGERIFRRSQVDIESLAPQVGPIINDIRQNGDSAVVQYIREFDRPNFDKDQIRVSDGDIEKAYTKVGPTITAIIGEQIRIARAYMEGAVGWAEQKYKIETVKGGLTGMVFKPIERVGLLVPAGKAPLPTVAQILTTMASVMGVKEKVVFFPPTQKNYEIIVAAKEAGADEIYRVGGVQAVAAFTFGTESIRRGDFIAGPGNSYVQAAKLLVSREIGIDGVLGPSEVVIMADETSNPRFLAADFLARLEHGDDSAAVIVTTSRDIANITAQEILRQQASLKRRDIIGRALGKGYSGIILVSDREEMIDFVNRYAPEHLEIQTENPEDDFSQIKNAGAVFLGNYSPVAVGDYISGTPHCLPTGGSANRTSAMGRWGFLRGIPWNNFTREGLGRVGVQVAVLSDIEGLDAHNRSVQIRLEEGSKETRKIGDKLEVPIDTKAILWDMDGVLIDSLGLDVRVVNDLLQKYFGERVSLSAEYIQSIFPIAVPEFWRMILKKTGRDFAIPKTLDRYKEILEEYKNTRQNYHFELCPGIRGIIEEAKRMRLSQLVVSNNPTRDVEEILRNAGILDFFTLIVGNDLEAEQKGLRKKPMPDTYDFAIKQTSFLPGNCVAIEDSDVGGMSAKAAGCYTIGVATGSATEAQLDKLKKIGVLDSIYSSFGHERN